jgi:penicillin amidase
VIDAERRPIEPGARTSPAGTGEAAVSGAVARMAARYLKRAKRVPALAEALNRSADRGSNSWVIDGRHTANGRPILASDPHLSLDSPALFSPIELEGGDFDIQGDSIAGSPYVILGQNRDIAFGLTTHFVDVTDAFVEQIRRRSGVSERAVHGVQGPARAGRGHR